MAKINSNVVNQDSNTTAWIFQVWASFIFSISATTIGIAYAPISDPWVRGYLGMGLAFSVGSSISVAKTTRDLHEAKKVISRIDEAKLERLLAEYDPFKK
jgi:hypothetical protein